MPSQSPRTCYRFAEFELSPTRRILLRDGAEVPLIPRYFDLLVLLVERRHEAVSRREILEEVWNDVVVSDGALSQAIRSLRRALGDDPREPRFIRTLSRHGYRFMAAEVVEAPDAPGSPAPAASGIAAPPAIPRDAAFEAAIERLIRLARFNGEADESEAREAAETLHRMGIEEALRRLDRRPGHAAARALLRDARWDVPGAGAVPLLGQPAPLAAVWRLVALRARRAARLAGSRWVGATLGGTLAGLAAGSAGGLALFIGPGSEAGAATLAALPLVGAVIGGAGAAGVGAGLAVAEVAVLSARRAALAVLGGAGGLAVGAGAHLLGRLTLQSLFGRELAPVAGGFEGLVIGAACGFGYALATPTAQGGMAAPRGPARLRTALATGGAAALACVALSGSGSYLGAMSLDLMARTFPGSQVSLDPLARVLGETAAGPVTRIVIGAFEGLLFGGGLAFGLTHRPAPRD